MSHVTGCEPGAVPARGIPDARAGADLFHWAGP